MSENKESINYFQGILFIIIWEILHHVVPFIIIYYGITFFYDQKEELTFDEAQKKLSNKSILMDVRSKKEWDNDHVINSIHYPLDIINENSKSILNKINYIICCNSGQRSKEAYDQLKGYGIKNINYVNESCLNFK